MPTTRSSNTEKLQNKEDAAAKEQKKELGTNEGVKMSNEEYGVGGTAKDGGKSTEATVEDGGPDAAEEDTTYKP